MNNLCYRVKMPQMYRKIRAIDNGNLTKPFRFQKFTVKIDRLFPFESPRASDERHRNSRFVELCQLVETFGCP